MGTFCHALTTGASAVPMACTHDDHTGSESGIGMLLAISDGLQIYRYTGRKGENKVTLTNEMYFPCSEMDSAANAGMNMVLLVSAS